MTSTPVKTERRKKLRKRPLRLVYVELSSGNGGMMRDLSEDGFAVRAMMPLHAGDQTPFLFTLGDTVRIEGEGKVLWIEEGGRVAGVEFTRILPDMRNHIDDWLLEDEKIDKPREIPVKEPAIAPASTIEELKEELRCTPARGEITPLQIEEPSDSQVSLLKVEEPPALEAQSAPANIAPNKQPIPPREGDVPKEDLRPIAPAPRVVPEPTAEAAASVTEGFFARRPQSPATIEERVPTRKPEVRLASLDEAPAPRRKVREISQQREEQKEPGKEKRPESSPLRDISEILIQPRGTSAKAGSRHAAGHFLPELPEPAPVRRTNLDWLTLSRAVMFMTILTVVVGMVVFHRELGNELIRVGEAMGGTLATLPPTTKASADNPPDANESSLPQSAKREVAPQSQAGPHAVGTNTPSSPSSASRSTAPPVTPLAGITPPSSPPEASPDAGQAEYLQAVQLLRGRNAGTDTPEAVRLLWVAVEKGNPSAEVTLADLYWHGQGVARNCDQTRILLTAAARKGSSEAQRRLQQFQKEGCE